jgi:hypothetical protein
MLAFCFANGFSSKAEYYQTIVEKLKRAAEAEALRKEAESKVDEVVELEDFDKMKNLYRNRDGSMETKPLYEKIKDTILKNDLKAGEPNPRIGYGE